MMKNDKQYKQFLESFLSIKAPRSLRDNVLDTLGAERSPLLPQLRLATVLSAVLFMMSVSGDLASLLNQDLLSGLEIFAQTEDEIAYLSQEFLSTDMLISTFVSFE